MKRFTLSALLFLAALVHSQNYIPDPSFGSVGVSLKEFSFHPKDIQLYNNNYYLTSSTQIYKMLYNGNTDESFGSNGLVSFSNSGNITSHSISGFKIIDGNLYVYGTTNADTSTNQDGFLAKLNAVSGALDSSFGTNGIFYVDFGGNESLNDFVLEDEDRFYCIGTKDQILTYFKLNANGSLDTDFDSTGYKQIVLTQKSYGNAIKAYNGNFLLVGTDYNYSNSVITEPLLLAMVNAQGTLVLTYGTGGTKTIELDGGMNIDILKTEISGNMLYADYFYAWSFITQGGRTIKYDLEADATVYNNLTFYNSFSNPEGDKLYTTGFYRCSQSAICERDFTLKRFNADGTPDTTFANAGTYLYNFPTTTSYLSDDRSVAFLKGTDGTILIAGNTLNGCTMLRIIEGALSTDAFNVKNTIAPNPFADYVTVSTAQQPLSAEVYDLTGRLVATPPINYKDSAARLDLSSILNSGVYLLTLHYGDTTVTQKIIKE